MPKTLAENRKTEPVLSCCKSSMTSALFSPRSKEIHWSEIGEILTLNGQGRTIKIWTAEMALQMIERGDFKQVKRGVYRMRGALTAYFNKK